MGYEGWHESSMIYSMEYEKFHIFNNFLIGVKMKNPYKTILKTLGLPYKTILGESSAKTVKGQSIGYLTRAIG